MCYNSYNYKHLGKLKIKKTKESKCYKYVCMYIHDVYANKHYIYSTVKNMV